MLSGGGLVRRGGPDLLRRPGLGGCTALRSNGTEAAAEAKQVQRWKGSAWRDDWPGRGRPCRDGKDREAAEESAPEEARSGGPGSFT